MKYALILIGILTKKQGVSSLCTALSLASFGMHWFGNVNLSTCQLFSILSGFTKLSLWLPGQS